MALTIPTFARFIPLVLPFLIINCSRGSSQSGPKVQVASVFNQLDPLPRTVGTYTTTMGPNRDIQVQFWYPLANNAPARDLYVTEKEVITDLLSMASDENLKEMTHCLKQQGISIEPTKRGIQAYLLRSMTTRSRDESAATHPSIAEGRHPAVILTHGFSVEVSHYCSLGESLASHGFIVIGVKNSTAVSGAYSKSKAIARANGTENTLEFRTAHYLPALNEWQEKIFSVITTLEAGALNPSADTTSIGAHINFGRIGMVGHSMGGVATIHAMTNKDHAGILKAGATLDCSVKLDEQTKNTTNLPFLYMEIRPSPDDSPEASLIRNNNKLPGGASRMLAMVSVDPKFKTSGHSNFQDTALLMNVIANAMPSARTGLAAPWGDMSTEESRAHTTLGFHNYFNKQLVDFFGKNL